MGYIPRTYQDHIDPQISSVHPCDSHFGKHRGDTKVVFVSGEWVCSSGHTSSNDIPTLRVPGRDPVAWVQENVVKIVRELPVQECTAHKAGTMLWGMDGHLWWDQDTNESATLKLCLPNA